MKYIDPNTGKEYTEEELLELAGDLPLQDYIAKKGYMQLVEEVEPVITEQQDFPTATASEGVDVVAQTPEAPENMDLDLENISLESAIDLTLEKKEDAIYKELRQAQKEYNEYVENIDYNNFGMAGVKERDALEEKVKEAKRKLEGSPIKLDIPETWMDKEQEEVINAFRQEFPGIVFEESGAQVLGTYGNAITANIGGEKIELDLKPIFNKSKKYKVLLENYEKIKAYDQVVKSNDIANQGAFSGIMDPIKKGIITPETFNKVLEGTGYSLITDDPLGGANQLVYTLLKDGKEVAKNNIFDEELGIGDQDNIENYIRDNFTKEETEKSFAALYPYLKTFAETKQLSVNVNTKRLNSQFENEPSKFFKNEMWNSQFNTYLENLVKEGVINEDEIVNITQQIEENFEAAKLNVLDAIAQDQVVGDRTGFNSYTEYLKALSGGQSSSAAMNLHMQEDVKRYYVDILKAAINNGSFSDVNKKLFTSALDQHLKYNLEDEIARGSETIGERIMYSLPAQDRELLRISLLGEQVEPDAIRDEIKNDGKIIVNYQESINNILQSKFSEVARNIKDIPGLEMTYELPVNGQDDFFGENLKPTFQITKLPDDLSESDYGKLLEAEIDLYELNLTMGRLQEDYNETVENYFANVSELETIIKKDKTIVVKDEDGVKKDVDVLSLWSDINKEYDLGDLVYNDFGSATARIALSIPTLFGSDAAMQKEQSMVSNERMFMSIGTYDDPTGGGGTWGLRTFSTQAPNILLAIGTGVVGNTVTKSSGIVKTAIGTTFGITSGTDTYRRLTLQRDMLDGAKRQKNMLNKAWNEGRMDTFTYTQGMLDAEKAIALYDMTDNQIFGSSLSTGIIEGTITRYIGTSNNTMKFLGDIKGKGPISVIDVLFKTPMQQFGMYGVEASKRIGLEILEEEIIYTGTQAISESLILGRDADWSQFDDTAMVTLVTAGVSNGSGVMVSGIKNYYAGKKFKEDVNKATVGIQKAIDAMGNKPESQQELTTIIQDYLKALNLANNSLSADIIASGSDNVVKIVGLEILKNAELKRAGVTPQMNSEERAAQIKKYKEENLTSDESERFDNKLNSIDSQINEIKEGNKNYDKAEELLGDVGKVAKSNLETKDPTWNDNMSKREEVALVIEEIHRMTTEMYKNKAYLDPNNQKEWNRLQEDVNKFRSDPDIDLDIEIRDKKSLSDKQKDKWMSQRGRQAMLRTLGTVTTLTDVETNINKIMGLDVASNMEVIVVPIEEQGQYLVKLMEQALIDPKAVSEITKGLKTNSNGFIVGNKYIVSTEEQRKQAIETGSYRKGVVLYHELGHMIDQSYFNDVSEFNIFADNLEKGLRQDKELSKIHLQAKFIVDTLYPEDANKAWKDKSDTYKDEYVREAQTLLYDLASNLTTAEGRKWRAIEDSYKEGIFSKIKNKIFDQSINTKGRALSYMIGNNAAFREGGLTAKVGKRVGKKGLGDVKFKPGTIKDSKEISDRLNTKWKLEGNKKITASEVDAMVNKVSSRAFSRFGLGVPFNIRQPYYDKNRFISHAKSKLQQIATEWNPSLGTFPSFMANRGMQRANSFVSELGVPDSRVKTERADEAKLDTRTSSITTEGELKERAKREAAEEIPSLTSRLKGERKKKAIQSIEQRLENELKYKLPVYNVDKTVKQKTNFINQLSKNLQLGFKDMIDFMGARNKTVNEYDIWLSDNYATLLGPNGLTTTYLSKAFPQAVEKYVNGMGWVKYDVWKGRKKGSKPGQIDFYKSTDEGPLAGSTAGNQKIRRVKDIKNAIPLAKFKSKYIKLSTNSKGEQVLKIPQMPTEGLAKQLSQEIGLDIFNNEIQKETSEIKNVFLERQKLFGADVLDNYVEQLLYDVSRPSIKNSLALLAQDAAKLELWFDKRFDFYKELGELMQSEDFLSKTDTQQKSAIKKVHKAVYGDVFTNDEHSGVSSQFNKLLVNLKKDPFVFQKLGTKQSYEEYMELILRSEDDLQSIKNYTGATLPVGKMLVDKGYVKGAREFVQVEFFNELKSKYGKNKALDLMVAYGAVSFSNGSFKFGGFKVDENGALVEHGESSNRAGIFGDKSDILKLIQKLDPNVVSIDNKTITFKNGKSRKVNINTSADVQMSHLKDKVNTEDEKTNSTLAWDFTTTFFEAIKKSKLDNNTTALLLGVMNGSSNSALRLAAPVWGRSTVLPNGTNLRIDVKDENGKQVYRTKKDEDGKEVFVLDKNGKKIKVTEPAYRYEHAVPARVVLYLMYDSIINGNKSIDLNLLKEDYRVTIIPIKEMDNVLSNTGFTQSMLAGYVPIPFALQSYADPKNKVGIKFEIFYNKINKTVVKSNSQQVINQDNNSDIAMSNARNSIKFSKDSKKIRIFDFDDTLARSKSKVIVNMPDGTTKKINATEFARDSAKLENQGATFNFTEFNKVIDGKKGPLFKVAKTIQDQRGSEDIFVLTARPQDAAQPIQEFLASLGLNIPLKNITGLEDGSPKAKADWVVNKVAEGYNDFYFTDDAFKNVKEVKSVLDVLDVKSKVQQARVKFSKNLDVEFNQMIERNKGVNAEARYSQVVAQRLGKNKKRFNYFIPPSADDFKGLTSYMFAGKGKQGEADQAWFDKVLIKPYTRGVAAVEKEKQKVSNGYKAIQAGFPEIAKKINKKIPGEQYTYDEAIRVYLWNKAEYIIPGISKRDQAKLDKIVREDPDLQSYADGVLLITKKPVYTEPQRYWQGTTITGDLNSLTTSINRKEYLEEFIRNVDIIFNEENLTKVEALYGSRVRESLENIIIRMKAGSNRATTSGESSRMVNLWNDWVNRSVGAIMFLNRRSGIMQLISAVNFINWSDNNIIKAGEAFFNQPQFWKDVVYIFNSDKLKQRRSGLKGDINEAEIAAAVKGSSDKMSSFISSLLKKGFIFTQIADSVAISTGGATFYRNRTNTYIDQGYTKAEAEAKAWEDFSGVSEEAQQSADPMMISQQQASMLGRFILNFQNTPMQYTRLMKKAGLDIINGRGDLKTNISKIIYYGALQNFLFSALSNALFALVPGFEDPGDEDLTEEEQLEKYGQVLTRKQDRIIHGMMDTILRGSGVAGAVIATIKNGYRRYTFEEAKGFTADHTYTIIELANLSPALGSKLRKIYAGIQTRKFERDVIAERGFDITLDGKFNLSSSYSVVGSIASGFANLPLDRLVAEVTAVTEMLDSRNTKWQRIALAMGWRAWDVNAKNEEHDLIKIAGKERRKREGIEKGKRTRKANNEAKKKAKKREKEKEIKRRANLTNEERRREDIINDSLQNIKINKQINDAFKKLDKLYGTDF